MAVAVGWGTVAIAPNSEIAVGAAPLYGHWGWYGRPALLIPLLVAIVVITLGPRRSTTATWRGLLVAAGAGAAVWAASLTGAGGWHRMTTRLTNHHQYEPFAATIDHPARFLATFTDQIGAYPTHVRGHPPGATLLPWALDRLGLGGAGWWQLLIVIGWGTAVATTLVAVRAVAGEGLARRTAPALVLLPAGVWATAADGLFAGMAATSLALTVVAIVDRRHGLAAAAGACFAAALLLTYGAALLATVPAAVAAWRRSWSPLLVGAGAAALGLVAVWAVTGFSWLQGLDATRSEYWAGVAAHRPTPYFVLAGNPGALALAVGPAVFAGLTTVLRGCADRRSRGPSGPVAEGDHERETHALLSAAKPPTWSNGDPSAHAPSLGGRAASVLPLAALTAVVLGNVSLLSKAEVERIWLLFMPWLAISAGTLVHPRLWLAAQAAIALMIVFVLRGG
ncbi:MAG: hypothetical protein ACRD29_13505 [Acidimicrobiales bacterium]